MSPYTRIQRASTRLLQTRHYQQSCIQLANPAQGEFKRPTGKGVLNVRALISTGEVIEIRGRLGWALKQLVEAGSAGCLSTYQSAPRWSNYVYQLKRKYGFSIERRYEQRRGEYPGRYARYVLLSAVTILDSSNNATEETA